MSHPFSFVWFEYIFGVLDSEPYGSLHPFLVFQGYPYCLASADCIRLVGFFHGSILRTIEARAIGGCGLCLSAFPNTLCWKKPEIFERNKEHLV